MGEQGLFLNPKNLTGSEILAAQEILPDVIDGENFIINARSEAHDLANFFDVEAVKNQDITELKFAFMEQYHRRRTMFGRLALFMSDDFYPYMNSLDLGKTTQVSDTAILDSMRHQYHRIRLIAQKYKDIEELPRDESKRTIHFRLDSLVSEDKDGLTNVDNPLWIIGERNRPLLRFTDPDTGDTITLPKRMTFAARRDLVADLPNEDGYIHDPKKMEMMEDLLDTGHPLLHGIRTLYYVTKKKRQDKA